MEVRKTLVSGTVWFERAGIWQRLPPEGMRGKTSNYRIAGAAYVQWGTSHTLVDDDVYVEFPVLFRQPPQVTVGEVHAFPSDITVTGFWLRTRQPLSFSWHAVGPR